MEHQIGNCLLMAGNYIGFYPASRRDLASPVQLSPGKSSAVPGLCGDVSPWGYSSGVAADSLSRDHPLRLRVGPGREASPLLRWRPGSRLSASACP
ncbi:unnamed protein product [Amoebophrya sp. A120]|nr:unnamed protein product [Amoebophrya sp. A120]|eukprot:GSA120T00008385001.1